MRNECPLALTCPALCDILKAGMQRRFRKPRALVAIVLAAAFTAAVFLLAGCGPEGRRFDMYGYFGTYSSVVIGNYGDVADAADEAAEEIEAALADIENAVSASTETSDVYRFNAAAPGERLEISGTAYEVLEAAMKMYEETDGAYNPAVGNLVDLWGFSPRFESADYEPTEPYDRPTQSVPDEEYIEAFSDPALLDFGAVVLEETGGKYYVTKPDASVTVGGKTYTMRIDLGGIGKGYAADRCYDLLKARGLTESYVAIGTSSLRLGRSAETPDGAPEEGMWRVTITHPRGAGQYLSVYAKDTAASTSGDYERYFIEDGVRYCHIIDPFTGYPTATGYVTGSLFGRTAAEGDALTTALAVMERSEAEAFAAGLEGCKYALLYYNENTGGYELVTNMSESEYVLYDESITVTESGDVG